ncbi:putative phosphopyruvate hydratase [Helianthus annuus]|nr:putative phosphopyruvate hydratase [Helianthus annuus]
MKSFLYPFRQLLRRLEGLILVPVVIGMNVAASEFYGKDKTCDLNFKEEVNQIGSVTGSIEAVKMPKHAGWGVRLWGVEEGSP